MHDNIKFLNDLEKTAYHEAGHAAVAKLLGKWIDSILLFQPKDIEEWIGRTQHHSDETIDSLWASLNLDRHIPYDELGIQYLGHSSSNDKYKSDRDTYTITCAGMVTEMLLYEQKRIDKNPMLSGESASDISKVAQWVKDKFPNIQEQEKELLNAESRARRILDHPICWCMVENLARKMVNEIHLGKEPLPAQPGMYKFSRNVVYESFKQTLNPKDA